jgi:hypothetical protein
MHGNEDVYRQDTTMTCGFAASRAERLCLFVDGIIFEAAPPVMLRRSLKTFGKLIGKAKPFRTEDGKPRRNEIDSGCDLLAVRCCLSRRDELKSGTHPLPQAVLTSLQRHLSSGRAGQATLPNLQIVVVILVRPR